MRLCETHDHLLRRSIAAAGLSSMLPENDNEKMVRLLDRRIRGLCSDNFDPYYLCHQTLFINVVSMIGPGFMIISGLPQCPLCAINEAHQAIGEHDCSFGCDERHYDRWIGDVVFDALKCYEKLTA